MSKLFTFISLMFVSISSIIAQDADGCKDHELLSRMPDFNITECKHNFDQLGFLNSAGEDVKFEGMLTYIQYLFNEASPNNEPSHFQIIKNYANAILKIGGKKVYEDDNYGCFELKKNGKEYKIMITDFANGGEGRNLQFNLYVLEMEAMKQEVTANEMLDALNKDGYIALEILFDTGKSSIQKESLPIVDQIYELLKSNQSLKVSIEGHTDNVGDAASNKKLSLDRAKSVMDALSAKGIDKSRLSFSGWGQEKPVADNRSEEGRTKNRRVEIVKK
jgi:OmpA-OmpF porin, OOP family